MAPVIVRRSISSGASHAGSRIQNWVSTRDPTAVFVVTLLGAFFFLFWLLGVVWSIVRKCRKLPSSEGWQELERKKYQKAAQEQAAKNAPARTVIYNPARPYDDAPVPGSIAPAPAGPSQDRPVYDGSQTFRIPSYPPQNQFAPSEEKEEIASLMSNATPQRPAHGRQGSGSNNLRPLSLVADEAPRLDVPLTLKDRVSDWTFSTWNSSLDISRSLTRKMTGKGQRKMTTSV